MTTLKSITCLDEKIKSLRNDREVIILNQAFWIKL